MEADLLTVDFTSASEGATFVRDLDEFRRVRYDASTRAIGVEFFITDMSLDLSGLPHRYELATVLRNLGRRLQDL